MTLESIFRRKIKQLYKQMGPRGWWPRVIKHELDYLVKHHAGAKSRWILKGKQLEVWEVGIGSILTQNTNWFNVEKAILNLARANEITPEKVSKCSLSRLQSLVRPAGYYKQKALKLKEFAKFVLSPEAKVFLDPKTDPEACRSMLLDIWGIGPETADNIVLYGLDKPVFVVDAYTRRLLTQLSGDKTWLTKPYEEIRSFCETSLSSAVCGLSSAELWQEAHALIVNFAPKKP